MFFVIEILNSREHLFHGWVAADEDSFCTEVAARIPRTIKKSTPHQLLKEHGVDSIDEARASDPWIAELADLHGIDATLYQTGDEDWQPTQPDRLLAHKSSLRQTLESLHIFESEQSAQEALHADHLWPNACGELARAALTKLLRQHTPAATDTAAADQP